MKNKIAIGLLMLLLNVLMFAQGSQGSNGNLYMQSRTFDYQDFNEVKIGSAIEAEFVQAADFTIEVHASEKILDQYLVVEYSGSEISIYLKPMFFSMNNTVKVYISAPDFIKISLSGASDAVLGSYASSEPMLLSLSGASSLHCNTMLLPELIIRSSGASDIRITEIIADRMDINVSASGDLRATGAVTQLLLVLSGASSADLKSLMVGEARLVFSGSSDAKMQLDGPVSAKLSGASSLNYKGNARFEDVDLSGASEIHP